VIITLIVTHYYNVGKCDDPSVLIHSDVIVMGFEGPALRGENITFTYPTGAMFSGPNSSMCTGNGEWEPDPSEVTCIHERELVTTYRSTMLSMYATKCTCTCHNNI
jgi:hypothetical protein